jgi:hypothetical protein
MSRLANGHHEVREASSRNEMISRVITLSA